MMNFLPSFYKFFLGVLFFAKLACSKKYGMVEITSKNYQDLVIDGEKDAWILAVKGAGKISLSEWEDTEYNLRGLFVRVGIIDPAKDGAFMKKKGFLQKDKTYPVARVFPYGGYKIKAAEKQDVKSLKEAERFALESLPDETIKIKSTDELQRYVQRGYAAKPLQMPVVLVTDKRVTSPLFRAIAVKYSKYFNFGVMRKPSRELMQNLQIKQLPAILIMIATESPDKQRITFSSVFYDTKIYGGISYLNLTRFFYSVHANHWADHPEARKYKGKVGLKELYVDDLKEIVIPKVDIFEEGKDEMLDKETEKRNREVEITFENHKRMCTDSAVGLCLIYFMDAKNKKAVKKALWLFKDLQKMPSIEGKPVHYLWLNASCHPEYGEIFGISQGNLPALLFVKPKQRLFKTMHGELTKESVGEVISEIFLGRENLARFSRFNEMLPVDCQKIMSSKKTDEEEKDKNGKAKKKKKTSKKRKDNQGASAKRKTHREDEL